MQRIENLTFYQDQEHPDVFDPVRFDGTNYYIQIPDGNWQRTDDGNPQNIGFEAGKTDARGTDTPTLKHDVKSMLAVCREALDRFERGELARLEVTIMRDV
jgi:hypothetical protein